MFDLSTSSTNAARAELVENVVVIFIVPPLTTLSPLEVVARVGPAYSLLDGRLLPGGDRRGKSSARLDADIFAHRSIGELDLMRSIGELDLMRLF